MIETIPVKGNVMIERHDAITGELLHREVCHNKVPLVGRNLICAILAGDAALMWQPPSHVAIGTGTSGPTDSDTQLGNEVYRNVITQKNLGSSLVTWKFFVPALVANGYNLSEAMITNSSGLVPVLPILSRVTYTPFLKTANITVTYTWTHTITETT